VSGARDVDCGSLGGAVINRAIRAGLGPVVAHVTADAPVADAPHADAIRGADWTARLFTAEKCDVLTQVLEAARRVDCRLVLLKGMSTALRYYPAPHLRTMGDIDLLAFTEKHVDLERELRGLGFRQQSHEPAGAFVHRHHGMPFLHRDGRVWIEIHTRLHPRQHPLAKEPRFSPEIVSAELSEIALGSGSTLVMSHERQLVYTSARWSEMFDGRRGVFPLLDAAFLLRTHGEILDWDRICRIVQGSWATTALRVMLTSLVRVGLAEPPAPVLIWLAANDRYSSQLSLAVVTRLIGNYLIGGAPYGRLLTTRDNVEAVWGAMFRPCLPWFNILRTPYSVCGSLCRSQLARLRRRTLVRASRAACP
jgi:hypothetical protein